MNRELPDVQAGFRKGRETRDQIANICRIMEKGGEFQKNIYFFFIDYAKAFASLQPLKNVKVSIISLYAIQEHSRPHCTHRPRFAHSSSQHVCRIDGLIQYVGFDSELSS